MILIALAISINSEQAFSDHGGRTWEVN
jgi:hypothetical protein